MTDANQTTRPAAMPADTPDYMARAWYGCISWALGNDDVRAAFEKETGHRYIAPKNGLDRMIDEFDSLISMCIETNYM